MSISIRKVFFACLLVGGVAYGIAILRNPHSSDDKRRMIEQLEKENETMHREIVYKQNYLKRLQQNPDELELEIKRRLLLVNPGSKSFILQDGTKADGSGNAGGGPDATPLPESDTRR